MTKTMIVSNDRGYSIRESSRQLWRMNLPGSWQPIDNIPRVMEYYFYHADFYCIIMKDNKIEYTFQLPQSVIDEISGVALMQYVTAKELGQ